MSNNKKPAEGQQADTIDRNSPFVQESFDLARLDAFAQSLGVQFCHYKAMVSPIGKKDRGDYRRSDGVDTVTSNGMIYRCAGKFTATMTDNSRSQKRGDSGILDASEGRLVMPRFYDVEATDNEPKRIYMAPGDRIYVSNPTTDVKVSNYHEMDYEPNIDNEAMYPICELEGPILDSRNIEYIQGVDFSVTETGNIRWLTGGRNPGIDPDTQKGRIYSIRYLYKAYWYIVTLPKEVRVTGVTNNGFRDAERMPYHAICVREYVYHNKNRGDETNQLPKDLKRQDKAPIQSTNPSKPVISVDMTAINDDDQQS